MSGETRELIKLCKRTSCDHDGSGYCLHSAYLETQRLAAVVEILLEAHPEQECVYDWSEKGNTVKSCLEFVAAQRLLGKVLESFYSKDMCQPCRDRALMERCDRAARGEK